MEMIDPNEGPSILSGAPTIKQHKLPTDPFFNQPTQAQQLPSPSEKKLGDE
jgi:hypothetical protein